MAVRNDRLKSYRFSSADYPAREQLDIAREVLGREIMRFEIEPHDDHPLDLDLTIRSLPGASLAVNRISPARNWHSSAMIEDDDPVLSVVTEGCCTWQQEGRGATLSAGQGLLTTRGAPGSLERHRASRVVNLRLKRNMLAAQVRDLEDALLQPIPAENETLPLLTGYARILNDGNALASTDLCSAVVLHLYDLAALVLGARRDAGHVAERRGLRAARLHAIKADIAANLASQDLAIAWIASRHGLSARAIRALFNCDDTTFTDYVLNRRLMRAHRRLRDLRFANHTISAIALDCGFGDLSYFNRAFRRRFGETPSDVRAQAV